MYGTYPAIGKNFVLWQKFACTKTFIWLCQPYFYFCAIVFFVRLLVRDRTRIRSRPSILFSGTPLSLGLTWFEVSSWLQMVTTLLLRALRTKSTRVYGDLFLITMAKFDELVVLIWTTSGRNWLSEPTLDLGAWRCPLDICDVRWVPDLEQQVRC